MSTFRYKILLKLKEIPWLQKPAQFSSSIGIYSDTVIINKVVQSNVSRNGNSSSVTITIDPDPIKKENILNYLKVLVVKV